MPIQVLPTAVLDHLRDVGDPEFNLQGVAADLEPAPNVGYREEIAARGILSSAEIIQNTAFRLAKRSESSLQPSNIEINGEKLLHAQRLFSRFGNEISGALLLAALPQTYATQFGAQVLVEAGRLTRDLRRRIRGTAQFLVVVMQGARKAADAEAQWRPVIIRNPDARRTPPAWLMCAYLRRYHQAIRQDVAPRIDALGANDDRTRARLDLGLAAHPGIPLNQEDLLGTLLTFTVTVFEVLEQFGITWTADDQEAYLHTWDVVGAFLGIGSPAVVRGLPQEPVPPGPSHPGWHGLRPGNVSETRALLQQIRDRQWQSREAGALPDDLWQSGRDGRLLLRSLLDELNEAMPVRFRNWPLAVMRQLAPNPVRDRLQLGASGVVLAALGAVPGRRATIGRFTALDRPNPVEARLLRAMSNEVTRRTMVHFLRGGRFVIPGLEAWADDLGGSGG
jgi:hypothetical protein